MDLCMLDNFNMDKNMVKEFMNQFLKNMKDNGDKTVDKVKESMRYYQLDKYLKEHSVKIKFMDKDHLRHTITHTLGNGIKARSKSRVSK